jgi:phosphotransferase system enzyme I (PtsI)
MLIGIPVSPGVAIDQALWLQSKVFQTTIKPIIQEEVPSELARLQTAIDATSAQLEKLHQKVRSSIGEAEAEIITAHLMMLQDPLFIEKITNYIEQNLIDVTSAVRCAADYFIQLFSTMEDNYMRERVTDIKDITQRLIANIEGKIESTQLKTEKSFILVADDITPSETVSLPKEQVQAIVVAKGGKTSHAAILARSLGIPAIMGVGDQLLSSVHPGDQLIVDGSTGELIIEPTAEQLAQYQQKLSVERQESQKIPVLQKIKPITRDNFPIELFANIESPRDTSEVLAQGGEGIGLFRTEFLFMNRDSLPSEEEQYQAYTSVVTALADKPVTIRTIDIGGDKDLPYLDLPKEANPFLGCRAIRVSLNKPHVFRTQLRALLRASAHGNVRILFPMISHLEQLHEVKQILTETKQQLTAENIAFDPELQIGVMMEVPSAVLIADEIAQEVDFFSIGTNDLVQYTLAVDRMNEKINNLYDHFHPAVLRLIKLIIDAAHRHHLRVGLCGEMAGDLLATEVLLGLGLDEFSVAPTLLPSVKQQILRLSIAEANQTAQHALQLSTVKEITDYLTKRKNT